MNLIPKRKKIIIGYSIIVFCLCIFFVPWVKQWPIDGVIATTALSHAPIWKPVSGVAVDVDTKRLAIELLGVSVLAGTLFVLVKD